MESTITSAWQRVLDDPAFRDLPYKVETTETGQIILSPHKLQHSLQQGRIMRLLFDHMPEHGEPTVEFPVETHKGVKVPDVVWVSKQRLDALPAGLEASPVAPEICVEVLSSANTEAEMEEKRHLYFEQGAREVWICAEDGQMTFYMAGDEEPVAHSRLLPGFPQNISEDAG